MVNVKRETCDEEDDDEDMADRETISSRQDGQGSAGSHPYQDRDQDRLRIKESVTNDSVFDGGGRRRGSQDNQPPTSATTTTTTTEQFVPVKSESNRHSPASVSSSDAALPSPGPSDHRTWPSNGQTNGPAQPVRPDIIFSHRRGISSDSPATLTCNGGPSPPPRPAESDRPTSRVPSVILGQSGGVKTMVWTGHWADQQQQQPSSTPSRPRSVPAGSEPTAIAITNRPSSVVNGSAAGLVKMGHSINRLDNNDPNIRLSVDGLLSLAQSSERRHSSASNRSSPPQVFD